MEKMNTNNNNSIINNILNKDFIISAIIPVLICLSFNKINMTLKGIILAGIWSIGVVILNFIKDYEINALAVITAAFSGIGLLGTVVSNNPNFYLLAPIVRDVLYALVFFLSVLIKKPLIQVIAEQIYLKNVPEEVKKKNLINQFG
ncbi:VC0807 family protein [Clostridium sp. JS66]|uniref:VC0807 family protein n=1 Tax=Clostridium sp. JS66 TaxID=3064705 RepID=UPI00298DD47F|nr:VC0807 family protein [Clostridium sp. JS66]